MHFFKLALTDTSEVMGKSKTNPQPNQIGEQEEERGEQTLADIPQRKEET